MRSRTVSRRVANIFKFLLLGVFLAILVTLFGGIEGFVTTLWNLFWGAVTFVGTILARILAVVGEWLT